MIQKTMNLEQALDSVRSVPIENWSHNLRRQCSDGSLEFHLYIRAEGPAGFFKNLEPGRDLIDGKMPHLFFVIDIWGGKVESAVLVMPNDQSWYDGKKPEGLYRGETTNGKLCDFVQEIRDRMVAHRGRGSGGFNQLSELRAVKVG